MSKFKRCVETQFLYKNKWIEKSSFRAILHDAKNNKKLANSYDEYKKMMASGEWFNEPQIVVPKKIIRKKRNGNPNS